jgi:menaquinone-dependent protoporphyrinogen IX oxidase
MDVQGLHAEEVGQLISVFSRELSTNEIALFSIELSAEFGQKNLHSTKNKSEKNINITIFLQNFKCSSTTAKDLVISAKISEVNFIFNVILMFEVSRLPASC